MPMWSYVEGNYGTSNFQHGFNTNKMKEKQDFVANEDVQSCHSLHVSQDPIIKNKYSF
jgi:hypothetical protein